jgi:enoyl-[acyl-carrier protein] reductase II
MRLLRNRVVNEWNKRIGEIPLEAGERPRIGSTVIGGAPVELHKFGRLLPTRETEGDWEEMPFVAGQGVGLIHDVRPAAEVVEAMMREAAAQLSQGVRVRSG